MADFQVEVWAKINRLALFYYFCDLFDPSSISFPTGREGGRFLFI